MIDKKSPSNLFVCSVFSVHGTAESLHGVDDLPDTQTSQHTDMNEIYSVKALATCCDCFQIGVLGDFGGHHCSWCFSALGIR